MQETKPTKKPIKILAIATFLNDFGSDAIYPIWPLFVTSVMGANMAVLGLIDGLGDAIVSISQAVSGYVSDRTKKRKVFVWLGYSFGGISRLGYAFATAWQQLIPFKVLDRAGKLRGAPRDAMIADASTNQDRGRNFGFLRMMDNLGAVCGILFCIFMFGKLGYKKLFLLAAIPSLIGAAMIMLLIKEKKLPGVKLFKGARLKNLGRDFRIFLFSNAFFALGAFSYSFLLVFAKDFGFKASFVPVLYLVFTATASIFSLPFGKLADKIGRKPVMLLSYVFWGLVCFDFIFIKHYWSIFIAFILFGLHRAALEPVQKTFVAELSPEEFRASGLGGFQMVIGLCALPSSLLAGILWDKIGVSAPFYLSLALTIIACGLLFLVEEK